MNSFEDDLKRLEQLTNDIKRTDISLEDALKDFEEGIRLSKTLEKSIDKIEGKIQILMNNPIKEKNEEPELDLFMQDNASTGSSGAPEEGLRQNV